MTQASQNSVLISLAVVAVILLVAGGFAVSSINSNLALATQALSNMPTSEAIAVAVVAGIVIPEMPEYDTSKIDELWKGVYGDDVEDLEDDAFIESVYQFFEDNPWELPEGVNITYVDGINKFFDRIEDGWYGVVNFTEDDELFEFLEDEYEDESEGLIRVQFIKEYEDKREINVINLGLDDEDDRKVELSSIIRVKIFLDEDDDTEYEYDKVYINSVVTSDDGDLEAEISYSL